MADSRKIIVGGHLARFWPEELSVARDEDHFLFAHGDPERTDPDSPEIRNLVAFMRTKGSPGRIVVYQEKQPDGSIKNWVVDGRRRRLCFGPAGSGQAPAW